MVDVFTDGPFAGNPAGVCLLDGPADAGWMQRLAAEMRHSETAYLRRLDDHGADYELRWFTPVTEVALCGHATLASAHALYEIGAVAADRPVRFRTLRSGVLTVRRDDGGDLEMDFPARPAVPAEAPKGLADELGVPIVWTGRTGENDLLVEVADERSVRGLDPDIEALARFDARGIIVTAQADEGRPYDCPASSAAASGWGRTRSPARRTARSARTGRDAWDVRT